jgi:hypothetical protein
VMTHGGSIRFGVLKRRPGITDRACPLTVSASVRAS